MSFLGALRGGDITDVVLPGLVLAAADGADFWGDVCAVAIRWAQTKPIKLKYLILDKSRWCECMAKGMNQ